MTAILGIFGPTDETRVTLMLSRMSARGCARANVWREGDALLAVSRHDWEFTQGFSGPVLVVQDGDHVIAADASLYYRDDLRRKLSDLNIRPRGQTPSHLILAAYQAYGEKCAEIIEGDFAFVIWDRKCRRIVACRDFGGKRPLYYAELDGGRTFMVASTISAILEHPACSNELNLVAVAATASNRWSAHSETCYKAVKVLAAAHTLVFSMRQLKAAAVASHWDPPAFTGASRIKSAEAAEELKGLLCRATDERLDQNGPTSIWMSGGVDSPAVFACGQHVLKQWHDGRQLLPVSISYPVGDPGREDELITSIAEHWGTPVRWIDSSSVPILNGSEERSAARDEPFTHAFELLNRELAAGSQAVGARVALDGNGGDQLFYSSDGYLADLLKAGSWRALRGQLQVKGLLGLRSFWTATMQPQLPGTLRALGSQIGLGNFVESPFSRPVPKWINRSFANRHGLVVADRRASRRLKDETCAAFEARWFLTQPFFPRVFSLISQYALENGVESRSPLYDRRLIAFAATRPRWERSSSGRTKQLLTHSMRELLPAAVLAPRQIKTGLMSAFFENGMTAQIASLSARVFNKDCALADYGIVDLPKVRAAVVDYQRTRDGVLGLSLFLTLQTEFWLRARDGRGKVFRQKDERRRALKNATSAA